MEYASIFNISRCCVDDGPGIRTTVFIKGCPLRCIWCHNPESQRTFEEITYDSRKCTLCGRCLAACEHGCHAFAGDVHTLTRTDCVRCGKCADACRNESLRRVGRNMSSAEVLEETLRDRIFYENSGGGVTLSGGEPLSHPEFCIELLTGLKNAGIHTAVETCGYVSAEQFSRIASLCDLLLYDIKETDPVLHKKYTGVDNTLILENLRTADRLGVKIHLRMPIIPGLNNRDEHFRAVGELAGSLRNLVEVQVMPYHKLGAYKYETLGKEYTLSDIEEPDDATKKHWQTLVNEYAKISR